MRKELKIIGSRDRHVFTATFIRFGFRDGYKGPVKTILLQDVLYVFLSAFCYDLFLRCYYHSLS